jgi:hypothetical protein
MPGVPGLANQLVCPEAASNEQSIAVYYARNPIGMQVGLQSLFSSSNQRKTLGNDDLPSAAAAGS